MKVVVDTNVFVSAAFKSGTPPYHVLQWLIANGDLLKSAETERELLLVLTRPRLAAAAQPSFLPFLETLLSTAELVPINEPITACRDTKDDKFPVLWCKGSIA
jgi:putative PIN family toxin of toxin-antitoxin system